MENPQLFLKKVRFTREELVRNYKDLDESGVYALWNSRENKYYVGISSSVYGRLLSHLKAFKDLCDYALALELGIDDHHKLLDREAYWCHYYDSFNNGYNGSRDGSGFDSSRGRIWVNDGKNNYRIYESQLVDNPDLVRGFLGCAIKGKINVTKTGIDKRIEAHNLKDFLEDDWQIGREFTGSPLPDGYTGYDPKRHKTYMNNRINQVYITDTWYHYWKDLGYRCGRLNDNYPVVTDGKEEVSIYDYELEEYKKKGFVEKYLVEYYDGKESLTFDESLIPDREKLVWVTNHGLDTRIEVSRLDEYLSTGWESGRSLIAAKTADGSYSPDRFKVVVNNCTEEISVVHYWLPYWLEKGYKIGTLSNKTYYTDGITDVLIDDRYPEPEGFTKGSLAELHNTEITEYYNKLQK